MKPHWRLHVEDFGRIAAADVDLRRLTLFVGPNNSGKSYLASLLWGLVALQFDLPTVAGPELDAVDEWLAQKIPAESRKGTFTLTAEDAGRFARVFDAMLRTHGTALAQRILRTDQISLRALSFVDAAPAQDVAVRWEDVAGEDRTRVTINDDLEPDGLGTDVRTGARLAGIRDILVRRVVFRGLFRLFARFADLYSPIDPVYLPASRTGFMQLYKAPARLSLRVAFRGRAGQSGGLEEGETHQLSFVESVPDESLDLTTPAYHFIDLIAFGMKSGRRGKFATEADFLEAGMGGRFDFADGTSGGINEYVYRPEGSRSRLSMKLSSALVTELGPLVLVLRHARSLPLLILEEPEAHLHPALQRRLAQVIVRLVRKGLCVWITTHSENFCQQLNNFIKLGSLPAERRAEAQRKFGFEPQDFLELDDVAGNEFRVGVDGRSTVVAMKQTEAGLVMPTFNREIVDLGRQTMELDDLLAQREA